MVDDNLNNRYNDSTKNYYLYDQYGGNTMEPVGPIGIIALPSMREFAKEVNSHLFKKREEYKNLAPSHVNKTGFLRENYLIDAEYFRFPNGEGKCILPETVKGHDIYIMVDVLNYSCTYKFYDQEKNMSPDEHYQDLKRTIQAISVRHVA